MIERSNFFFILYGLLLLIFFELIGLDAVREVVDFQFYADTPTYHMIYDLDLDYKEIINLNPNLFGPLLILNIFNGNYHLIFLTNLLLLFISFSNIKRCYNLNNTRFLFILIICPLMLGSLMGVNKEIFSILVCSYLLLFLKTKTLKHLIIALFLCFFVRWQLLIFVLAISLHFSKLNTLRRKPFYTIAILVISISLIYPFLSEGNEIISHINKIAELGGENSTKGSGLYTYLIELQKKPFGYIISFIPKALQLLGGLLFRWKNFANPSELYNSFFMFMQSLSYVIMVLIVLKKKLNLNNELIFVAIVYLAIFSISPIYAPRYLFPIYIFLGIELSKKHKLITRI